MARGKHTHVDHNRPELKSAWKLSSNEPCLANVVPDNGERKSAPRGEVGVAHKGVLGLVEGGVSMWGLKGVAWQPPPALRNGRHTRHTHTPPSPFLRPNVLLLLRSFFPLPVPLSLFLVSYSAKTPFFPAHNTYPARPTCCKGARG